MADSKVAGLILLVLGIIFLVAGIFVGMSSTSLATSQNSAYDIFTSGTIRIALGIGLGCLGAVLIAVGILASK